MIKRAIENWLTSATERNYQLPLCQVLLKKGQKIIYVSSHGPMEQGKDIVAIDSTGCCFAYQLKRGKIDVPQWRSMSGEIRELMELPFLHPSVDKHQIHRSFLVTTGEITDPVRMQIDQINDDNRRKGRRYSYLDLIDGHALLSEFVDAHGEFLPKEPRDFQLFLEHFLADGTDFLQKAKFYDFCNNSLFDDCPRSESSARDAVSSSVIIAGYMLNPYQTVANYYAQFEAWTCLAGCIVRYACKNRLREECWRSSFDLATTEVVRNLSLLKKETLQRKDFLEGDWMADGGFVYQARATIVLGAMAALETHLHSADKKYVRDDKLVRLIKENVRTLWFWGESAFPFVFAVIKYLELSQEHDTARFLVKSLLDAVIQCNSPRREAAIPNPYYGVSEILQFWLDAALGIPSAEIDLKQFSGSSYTLGAIVEMAARRNDRKLLESNWKRISHIYVKEFRLDRDEDIFLWRAEEGSNHEDAIPATQSWASLVNEANDLSSIPSLWADHVNVLRFLTLACPHRANKVVTRLLDKTG